MKLGKMLSEMKGQHFVTFALYGTLELHYSDSLEDSLIPSLSSSLRKVATFSISSSFSKHTFVEISIFLPNSQNCLIPFSRWLLLLGKILQKGENFNPFFFLLLFDDKIWILAKIWSGVWILDAFLLIGISFFSLHEFA